MVWSATNFSTACWGNVTLKSKAWYPWQNHGKMKNKGVRLGRFKNRHEARKKAMNSWDRDLSIDNLKWCVWGRECGQSKSGFRFWDQKLCRVRWGLAFGARNFNVLTWFSSPKLEILTPKIVLVQNLIQNWCLVLFGYFQILSSEKFWTPVRPNPFFNYICIGTTFDGFIFVL